MAKGGQPGYIPSPNHHHPSSSNSSSTLLRVLPPLPAERNIRSTEEEAKRTENTNNHPPQGAHQHVLRPQNHHHTDPVPSNDLHSASGTYQKSKRRRLSVLGRLFKPWKWKRRREKDKNKDKAVEVEVEVAEEVREEQSNHVVRIPQMEQDQSGQEQIQQPHPLLTKSKENSNSRALIEGEEKKCDKGNTSCSLPLNPF